MAKRKTLTNQELCDFLDNLSEIEDEFDDDEVELFGNSITKRDLGEILMTENPMSLRMIPENR